VHRVLSAVAAELLQGKGLAFARGPGAPVVPGSAEGAGESDANPLARIGHEPRALAPHHHGIAHSMILITTPAPTVLPPSRIAKRICSSSATVVMSSTSIVTLSPGITILTPSGSCTLPVTSVVRM